MNSEVVGVNQIPVESCDSERSDLWFRGDARSWRRTSSGRPKNRSEIILSFCPWSIWIQFQFEKSNKWGCCFKKFQDKIKKKSLFVKMTRLFFKHFTSSVSIEFSEFSGTSSTPPHSLILFIHFLLPFSSNLGFFKCISLLQDSKPLKLKYWCVTWFCSNWKKPDPMNQNTASTLDIKYKDKTCQRCWRPMRDVS